MGNPNPKDYHLFNVAVWSTAMEILIYGANRIGKTETGAYITCCYLLGWCPYTNREYPWAAKGWIITDADNVPTVLEKLRNWLPANLIEKWNEGKGAWYIKMKNGAEVWIKTHDQERRKFVGSALDFVWWDEEPMDDIYLEVATRLVDRMGRMIWTMTPIEGQSALHTYFKELNPKYREAMSGDLCYVQGGVRANPYLRKEAVDRHIARAKEIYKGRPEMYAIRIEGEYIVFSGSPIFHQEDIKRIYHKRDPKLGVLEYTAYPGVPYAFVETEGAWLEMWLPPKANGQYTIGTDVAMGLINNDFSCSVVLDRDTLEVPAILHGPLDPRKLGVETARLGHFYNDALVNPETNPPGNSTLEALLDARYPRIMHRESATGKHQEVQRAFGALTSKFTKPAWVETAREAFATQDFVIYSKDLIEEMKWFRKTRKDDRKTDPRQYGYAAISGHDDRVMAFIHALMAHVKNPYEMEARPHDSRNPEVERIHDALESRGVDLEELGITRY